VDAAAPIAIGIGQGALSGPVRPFFTRVESLRGVGALAIAAYHFSGYGLHGVVLLPHQAWPHVGPIQNVAGGLALSLIPGHAALMMFFVISGLVLQVSLQHGPQQAVPAALRFFVARIFRIFPIVIFGTLVFALANGWQTPPLPDQPAIPLGLATLVQNFLLLDVTMNATLWALQVEALMAPIILAIYLVERAYGLLPVLALLFLAIPLSFSGQWAGFEPLSHNLFAFVLGMLIPGIGRDFASRLSRSAAQRWLAATAALMFLTGPILGFYSQWGAVIEAHAAAVLLALVAYRSDLRGARWLDAWPLRQLGLSSGSYYVLHGATMAAAVVLADLVVPSAWSANAPVVVGVLVIASWLVLIAPLMLASYHAIEAPGIALGRLVIASLTKRPAPQQG
jgi:peptidoglycan/LPS O-acetylase OafA/YrhL